MSQLTGKRRILLFIPWLALLIMAATPVAYKYLTPIIQKARYERALRLFGGRRFTRTQAGEQIDDRDYDLLPDSEYLPEPHND